MTLITMRAYLGPYDDARISEEVRENAVRLVAIANVALAAAEADGVEIQINPSTGTHIAGDGNGGVRPTDSPVGAPKSAHKRGAAVDIYDPDRELARWSLRNQERLKLLGIRSMENPRWAFSWCHWSIEILSSGNFVFIPSNTAPLADALPEQLPPVA
jgi:hypothetical protein